MLLVRMLPDVVGAHRDEVIHLGVAARYLDGTTGLGNRRVAGRGHGHFMWRAEEMVGVAGESDLSTETSTWYRGRCGECQYLQVGEMVAQF